MLMPGVISQDWGATPEIVLAWVYALLWARVSRLTLQIEKWSRDLSAPLSSGPLPQGIRRQCRQSRLCGRRSHSSSDNRTRHSWNRNDSAQRQPAALLPLAVV